MKNYLFSLLLAASAVNAHAQVSVEDPWARATVSGQPVGAAYMTIHSTAKLRLVSAESEAAKSVQVHTMHHQDGVMKMRRQGAIEVEPDKPLELAPGGTHLMLIGLKGPLVAGESVQLKLTFKDAKGALSHTSVSAPIKPIGE